MSQRARPVRSGPQSKKRGNDEIRVPLRRQTNASRKKGAKRATSKRPLKWNDDSDSDSMEEKQPSKMVAVKRASKKKRSNDDSDSASVAADKHVMEKKGLKQATSD
jgi:hypothetical protein